MPLNKKDVLALSAVTLFSLYLFRDIVFSGHLLIGDDFIAFYLGMKNFLYEEIRLYREVPYWNPFLLGGMPFWAHFESTIFYPLGFLFYLLPPEIAYGYTMLLHIILAGVFMYILARSLGMGPAGGFVAGSIFTCNGFIMATLYLGHMCPLQSYIWLPLILYFLNRAMRTGASFLSILPAGVLWGVQILAGAPQDAFYTFLASTLFLLCNIESGRHLFQSVRKRLLAIPLVFAVGVGIASVQLVPAIELIGQSVRGSLNTFELVTQASYPPEGLITAFLPNFFGNYAKGGFWVDHVPWSVPFQNLHVGFLPLMALVFISYRDSDHKRLILFAAILAVVAILLALGRHTPVYKLAYHLPGFDKFRTPARIITLWVFAIALLGGKGFESLIRRIRDSPTRTPIVLMLFGMALLTADLLFHVHRPLILKFFSPFIMEEAVPERLTYAVGVISSEFHRFALITSASVLCILLVNRRWIRSTFGIIALCALLLLDLGSANSGGVRLDKGFYPWIERIKKGLDARIGPDESVYRVGSYPSGLGPNIEMLLGYQTVGGFTALIVNQYYEYMNMYADGRLPQGWQSLHYGEEKNTILMDLLNVKYVISHKHGIIQERKSHLPRVFIVPGYERIDNEQVLQRLVDPDFNPRKTILLETGDALPEHFLAPLQASLGPGLVEIIEYRPDRIAIKAESPGPALLFLSEIHYPGWKARLDGRPTSIMRGNHLFRVIELSGGSHTIELFFDPLSIKLGIWGTILTLCVLLGIIAHAYRKKRHYRRTTRDL